MAGNVENSDIEDSVVDMLIMEFDNSDENGYFVNVPTQNRFTVEASGRGNPWRESRGSKRKKVSSAGSAATIDKHTLSELSEDGRFMYLNDALTKNIETIDYVKNEQTTFFKAIEDLQSSVVTLSERADRIDSVIEKQSECLKMLSYRSIDIEAQSKRNNLILFGISERRVMNTVQLVYNFLEDELDIYIENMVIERAHRLGSRSNNRSVQDPKRPILVRFRDHMDTDLIMWCAYKLKGTPFGIDRDYPKEISNARKQLYMSEEAIDAKRNRKKVQIAYPAKLIIEGQLKSDKFPEWQRHMVKDRMESIHFKYKKSGVNVQVRGKEQHRVHVRENIVFSESHSSLCSESGADEESENECVFTAREDKIPAGKQAKTQSRDQSEVTNVATKELEKNSSINTRGRLRATGRRQVRKSSASKTSFASKNSVNSVNKTKQSHSVKPTFFIDGTVQNRQIESRRITRSSSKTWPTNSNWEIPYFTTCENVLIASQNCDTPL